MRGIIILTGSEPRHTFFRKYIALSEHIKVYKSYCEGQEKNLKNSVEQDLKTKDMRLKHLNAREMSEVDFFDLFIKTTADHSNPVFLPRGNINNFKYTQSIINAKPDLLVAYGCSIIDEPLLSVFDGYFINVHLGLSPYYRGSGTNYWPLVNNEPEYVGVTFMYMGSGIDKGEIIHQVRARYSWGDTPAQVGNRLILDMCQVCRNVINNFDYLIRMPQLPNSSSDKFYQNKDFTEESVKILYDNFKNDLIDNYLCKEHEACAKVPIIQNPALDVQPK